MSKLTIERGRYAPADIQIGEVFVTDDLSEEGPFMRIFSADETLVRVVDLASGITYYWPAADLAVNRYCWSFRPVNATLTIH